MLTPEEAIQQREKEKITVQFEVASAEMTSHFGGTDLMRIRKLSSRTEKGSPS